MKWFLLVVVMDNQEGTSIAWHKKTIAYYSIISRAGLYSPVFSWWTVFRSAVIIGPYPHRGVLSPMFQTIEWS